MSTTQIKNWDDIKARALEKHTGGRRGRYKPTHKLKALELRDEKPGDRLMCTLFSEYRETQQ